MHRLVGADLVRRAFDDHAAVVHHRHATGDAERDVHVVLDQDQRDRWIESEQELGERDTLAARTGSKRWTPERAYELFPRLRERKRNGGAQLSGGEQQMLAIARALLTNPTLLIMDEPSEGLAPAIIEHLVETFKKLEQEGLSILLIEQNLGVATSLAERQLVMVAGSIYAETTATELSKDPELQRRFLGVEPLTESA